MTKPIATVRIVETATGNDVTDRYVTGPAFPPDERERFQLVRLCDCTVCGGTGKWNRVRCRDCRGEGQTRQTVATCASPEAVGVALVTLGREGEWDECPIGILDTLGETGQKWIVRPWLPSARNVSAAGRTLRQTQLKGTP
jgi:hypothetical protein